MTTPRENLLRSLRRQGFEVVPLDCGAFCTSQAEAFKERFGHADTAGYFGSPFRGCSVAREARWSDPLKLYPRETLPANARIDAMGVAHSSQPNCYHMTRMHHPLQGQDVSLDEVQNYPLASIPPGTGEALRQVVDGIHSQGLASMAHQACTIWETAWYLRSMEDLMADMMTDDERATVHLSRVTGLAVESIQTAARAGVDIVQLGDDIGMQSTIMMSLELWRKWLKPHLAMVIQAGKSINPDLLIFYHSCGYVLPFLNDLIEIGVDILNPVQPESMKFDEVYREVGGRISFWGTIGTQSTLPFGTPAEVKQAVWSNLRTCGKQGGIVIAPTHMVEPEVPWENLMAMQEACKTFRL
ncbi:MAG: uroporphyrinogen decarboxylase family protein [bacterium]